MKVLKESKYKGYRISFDNKWGCYNIYDIYGELEDYGFKSEEEAMKEVDKICERESIKEGVLMNKYKLDKLDTKDRYRMLDRMRSDCEYCINSGSNRHLWVVNDPKAHCDLMRELYNSLEDKPDWLSLDDIDRYEKALLNKDESLDEDTVKTSDGKWTNKGKEGTHGKFKTKKAADAQRKAMFANGYKESLSENFRSTHTDELESKSVTDLKPGDIVYVTNGMYDWCIGEFLGDIKTYFDRRGNVEEYEYKVEVLVPLTDHLKRGNTTSGFSSGSVSIFTGDIDNLRTNENLTVKDNEFLTKQDVDAAKWLIKHGKNASEGQIKRAQEIIKQYKKQEEERLDTKSMNEKLNKNQISAFKDIIGFNADVEEDLEEDFIDDTIADYDSIYGEVALEKLVEKIENDFKNEPFEESEDELTERLANEFAAKQYKRAYDCYCGQVKTRYGSLDERNLPIDEKLIDYASCKCNYDANVLKEKLIQGMRDLNDQWLTEGKITLPELRKEYGKELIDAIQNEFEDYRIYLRWYLEHLYTDNVGADNKSYITISIKGVGDDLYEISNDECGVLVKFITDVISQFTASHAYKIANRSVSLKDKSLTVVKPTEDSVSISFMLREDFNLSAFNGDSIDAVAEGIGRFEPASTTSIRCNGHGGSKWRTDLPGGEVMAKIAYQRQGGLSYGNGFKYWDRFKRITRIFPKSWSTNIRMAAEYIPNPDVVLVWADFPVLMHRSDFEDAIRAVSQEALQALKSN